MSSPPSDDDLMLRYGDGDVDAFEELHNRYRAPVYGFCLRSLGNSDAAVDAFQDTFRKVVDARHRYKAQGRFASWIFTIARRVCVDRVRETRQHEPLSALDENQNADHKVIPITEQISQQDEIRRLLAALSPEHREVLLLSKYQGFSYREIAGILGSTEAAVKQKVYRALEVLRNFQEPHAGA